MESRRNLSLEGANRFAGAFNLKGNERQYFLSLVLFNQARTLDEKESHLKELKQLNPQQHSGHIKSEQYSLFSNWWNVVIREMVNLPDFRNSAKWISRNITPGVNEKDIEESFNLLKKLGMLKRVEGKWRPSVKTQQTDPMVRSVTIARFHRQMINLGLESLGKHKPHQREISGTTLGISGKDVGTAINLIRDFRKKMAGLAAGSEPAEQVYQMNIQFFSLVQPERGNKSKD